LAILTNQLIYYNINNMSPERSRPTIGNLAGRAIVSGKRMGSKAVAMAAGYVERPDDTAPAGILSPTSPEIPKKTLSPEAIVESFYDRYLTTRKKQPTPTTALEAAQSVLYAAGDAAWTTAALDDVALYAIEFQLPEQLLLRDRAQPSVINGHTMQRIPLLPETRQLGIEIVQAWIVNAVDAPEKAEQLNERPRIPHASLEHGRCSLMSTMTESDLTPEELGVTSVVPGVTQGDKMLNLKLLTERDGHEDIKGQIRDAFMASVTTNW